MQLPGILNAILEARRRMYELAETAIVEEAVPSSADRARSHLLANFGEATAQLPIRIDLSPRQPKDADPTFCKMPTLQSAARNLRRHALILVDLAAGLAVLSIGAILLAGAMIIVGTALVIASTRR